MLCEERGLRGDGGDAPWLEAVGTAAAVRLERRDDMGIGSGGLEGVGVVLLLGMMRVKIDEVGGQQGLARDEPRRSQVIER